MYTFPRLRRRKKDPVIHRSIDFSPRKKRERGEKGEGRRWESAPRARLFSFQSRDIKAGISNGAKAMVNEVLVWAIHHRGTLVVVVDSVRTCTVTWGPVHCILTRPQATYVANHRVQTKPPTRRPPCYALFLPSFSFDQTCNTASRKERKKEKERNEQATRRVASMFTSTSRRTVLWFDLSSTTKKKKKNINLDLLKNWFLIYLEGIDVTIFILNSS